MSAVRTRLGSEDQTSATEVPQLLQPEVERVAVTTAQSIDSLMEAKIRSLSANLGDYVGAENVAASGLASTQLAFLKDLRAEFRVFYDTKCFACGDPILSVDSGMRVCRVCFIEVIRAVTDGLRADGLRAER